MADDNAKIRIQVAFEAEEAVKKAEDFRKQVEKAIKLKDKINDSALTGLIERLETAAKAAEGLRDQLLGTAKIENIGLSTDDAIQNIRTHTEYEKIKTEELEKQLKLEEEQNKLLTYRGDPEKGILGTKSPDSKVIANTEDRIAGLQSRLVYLKAEGERLLSILTQLESKSEKITFNFDDKASEVEEYNKQMQEAATVAEEVIQRYEFLSESVEKTAAAEAGSAEEFDKVSEAMDGVAESSEKLSGEGPTEEWEEHTAAAADSVQDLNDELKQTSEASEGIKDIEVNLKGAETEVYGVLKRISELREYLKGVKSGIIDANPAQIAQAKQELAELTAQVKQYVIYANEAAKANSTTGWGRFKQELIETIANIKTAMGSVDDFRKSILNLGHSFKQGLTNSINTFQHNIKSLRRSMKHGLTAITKYILGFRSLFFLVRRMRKFIKEGIENLVQYNDTVNKGVKSHNLVNDQMNELQTSLLYLKNAWAAAFSPIMIKVIPILVTLINTIADAGNAVARFIAKLTGQENAYNALRVQAQDYADSLDDAGKSAKKNAKDQDKLNQSLADYDKLLVIQSKNDDDANGAPSGGSGASAYSPKVQDMFTVVDSADSLAQALLDAFKEGGWASLGSTIADTLADAFGSIQWEEIQLNVKNKLASLGEFINGFIGNTNLWDSFGKTAGQALNTVAGGINALLTPIDTFKIGWNVSSGLRHFLTTVDWKNLGSTVKLGFDKITDGLKGFLDTFPTEETAKAIVDFIDGLNLPDVIETTITLAGKFIATAVELAANLVVEGSERLSEKLVGKVSKAKIDKYTVIEDDGSVHEVELQLQPIVDWTINPIQALFESLFTDIGKILTTISTGGKWDNLDALADLLDIDRVNEKLDLLRKAGMKITLGDVLGALATTWGEDLWEGFKKGLMENPITDWLVYCVIDPIVVAFTGKSGLDINSPSKKSEYWGQMLIEGFKLGLSGFWEQIKSIFIGDDGIITKIGATFNFDNLKTTVGNKWGEIKGVFEEKLKPIRDAVESAKKFINDKFNFENVRQKVATKWNEIRDKFAEKLQKIRDKVESAKKFINEKMDFENVRKKVATKWQEIKDFFVGSGSPLGKIQSAFNNLKLKNPFETIYDTIIKVKDFLFGKDGTQTKKAAATGYLSTKQITEEYGGFLEQLKKKFKTTFEGLQKVIVAPINGILDFVQSMVNGIIDGLNKVGEKLSGLKISGTNPFTGKEYSYGFQYNPLKGIDLSKYKVKLAEGAVIPPNREFLAVLGDQKQGVNIETPLATMVDAFKIALAEGGGNINHEPIVLQLNGRVVAQAVWDEEDKKYKQTGFGLAY